MCDKIIMPDGTVIESIHESDNDVCLCNSSQHEILTWIIQKLPEISIDQKIEIIHSQFGYEVYLPTVYRDIKAR